MRYNTVGVICAMEKEAARIRDALREPKETRVASLTFFEGFLGERRVILSVCGIGKVFAAICAQTLILHFHPDAIYNSGVAGSLSPALEILDVAVSTDLVQHDMDTSPLGDPVGLISGINRVSLPADETLRRGVLHAAEGLGIRALEGTVASGDQFIASPEKKAWIKSTFDPIACEMEGAAIAQVAYVNRIPFCAIRAISDSFTGQNKMDYARFASEAAARGAALLISLLQDPEVL